MKRRKSRIKKPIYTVRNALRPQMRTSDDRSPHAEFYEKHYVVIWVIVIFIILPLFIFLRGLYLGKVNSVKTQTEILSQTQLEELNNRYPEGYILFEISGGKMTPLKLNTFPKKFQANWSYARVSFKNENNDIRIYLPDIYYEPGHFNFVTLDATFSKTKGRIFTFLKNDTSELAIEIIEDKGDKILCVLSIRSIIME